MERIAERSLKEKGIELPQAPTPVASYVPWVRVGNLVWLSGQGTMFNGKRAYVGRVGAERTPEEGYQAARICALNLLAQLRSCLGSLDRVSRVVNLRGYVNCTPDFLNHPQVINGASDLMTEVFGPEIGAHSRTALGVSVLPNNITAEVELVVAVDGEEDQV